MATDSIILEGLKAGFHGTIQVTPLTVSGTSRIEVPPGGIPGQLFRRKSIMLQNTDSGTIWIGNSCVGYAGDAWDTCSGIQITSGNTFTMDCGRARVYAYNPEAYDVHIKLLEVS